MKVSFFGNCQLENIAGLIRNVSQQHQMGIDVLWGKAIYLTKPEEHIAVMVALQNSDIIYTQYHDTRWGIYSTQNLQKLFNVKIVPTLESFASVPQTSEWNVEPGLAALNIHYMDFRILDLYLKNTPVEEVAQHYFSIAPKPGALENEIRRMTEKYREYFTSGKVMLDYSEMYEASMQTNPFSYHTFNHPNNKQLEWMLNKIMQDIGVHTKVNLDGPEVLNQFLFPSLIGGKNEYVLFQIPLQLDVVAKTYYSYLNTIDREILASEFKKSNYFAFMDVQ